MGKKELYKKVSDQLLESLKDLKESDGWEAPWATSNGLPRNGHNGHFYSGGNLLNLMCAPYDCPRWYTYKQAQKEGGNVKKGESGTTAFFFKMIEVDKDDHEKTDEERRKEEKRDDFEATKTIPWIKVYTLFNEEQTTVDKSDNDEDFEEVDPIEACEQLAPDVEMRSGQPSYNFREDFIRMPEMDRFDSSEAYYKTLFHEVGHWTGHESRLDRDLGDRFGSDAYAFEELVAEITASFLCAEAGIEYEMKNPAKYIDGWISRLEDDEYAFFTACRHAKEASRFVTDRSDYVPMSERDDEDTEQAA